MKIMPELHVENILAIPKPGEEERRKRKMRNYQSAEKDAIKKSKIDSLLSERDRQVRVQEIHT